MSSPRLLAAVLVACLLLIAACAPATPEQSAGSADAAPAAALEATVAPLPTETPAPTATPTPAPVAADTPAPTVAAEPAPTDIPAPEADWTHTVALVEGLYVRGNPNAPIRLVDYSDFF